MLADGISEVAHGSNGQVGAEVPKTYSRLDTQAEKSSAKAEKRSGSGAKRKAGYDLWNQSNGGEGSGGEITPSLKSSCPIDCSVATLFRCLSRSHPTSPPPPPPPPFHFKLHLSDPLCKALIVPDLSQGVRQTQPTPDC